MKEEVKRWMAQAKEDSDTAKFNFKGKKYKAAAFWCQQSAEKALKALMLKKTGKIKKIHDLVVLSKDLEIPNNLLKELKELTLAYVYSRYPDVSQVKNLKDKVSHFLEVSKEVLKWTKKRL